MLTFDVITLFPEVIEAGTNYSIARRAQERGAAQIRVYQLREFTQDKHRKVDDAPYGGGAGMVMKPEPAAQAVRHCQQTMSGSKAARIVLLEPQGILYGQSVAESFAQEEHLILLCGHYEGFDARIRETLATDVVSIGDFVLTGGELPALIVIDSVIRLLPGVLGAEESLQQDSYADGLLGYPQYTRPEEFEGIRVPEVLLSGHHGQIAQWRRQQQLLLTRALRPDLFAKANLTKDDLKLMKNRGGEE